MTTRKALTVVSLLVCLVILTFIIPARWVGVTPNYRPALVLLDPTDLASLSGDEDKNNNPDWRDLLIETTSTSTKIAASKMVVSDEEKARLNDPNNLTASFSKNLYTAVAYAQQNGGLTADTQKELMTTLLDDEAKKIQVKTYLISDLKTVSSTDEAKKAYGNALGTELKKADSYNLGQNDLGIINAYVTNKDPSPLASFTIKKNNVDHIIGDLLSMSVPLSAASYHLILINRLSTYRTTLDNMSQAESDPVRAEIAFDGYLTTYQLLLSALGTLQNYFVTENVQFLTTEPGYLFVYGYTTKK